MLDPESTKKVIEIISAKRRGTSSTEHAKRTAEKYIGRDGGPPTGNDERELERLARLSQLQYEREREACAERLGLRVTALDSAVKAERARIGKDHTVFLRHWNVEPWSESVDGAALLNELRVHLTRYVVLPKHADVALALWVLHTWIFDCFDITPYLAITSPTRRCGKTVLMTMLYWLCSRAKKNDSMSKAAIYRSVERDKPTLVLDEVGWVVDQRDERQNVLCGGFERNGYAEVCEGEGANIETKLYSTFCPKAFGLIGKLVAVLMDRSIEIQMQRKRGERVERLRRSDNEQHARLRQKCLRWAEDNRQAITGLAPLLPAALNDRAADIWEPLLAIATHIGGGWIERATDAALALSGGETANEERAVQLLKDIKAAFDASGRDEFPTKALVIALCADEERPWATWNKGKPISDRQLAKLVGEFQIISETVHPPGEKDAKGYKRVRFLDAFERYLTPPKGAQDHASSQPEGPQASKRTSADEMGISHTFCERPDSVQDGNEKCKLSYSHTGLDIRTPVDPRVKVEACSGPLCGHCGQPTASGTIIATSTREGAIPGAVARDELGPRAEEQAEA